MPAPFRSVRILGIEFFNDELRIALDIAHHEGGLILAPPGPGLANLGLNQHYDTALGEADVNLIDSGYLALLWKRKCGESLRRH